MTLGCKVNQVETEAMESLFEKSGYERVNFTEVADIYVINTCSVTSLAEQKSRKIIHRAHRLNPVAIIAVVGCFAQAKPQEVAKVPGVGVVIGAKDKGKIVELVESALKGESIARVFDAKINKDFEEITVNYTPNRTRAFLKIEDGCENFCSYCIIPHLRGPIKSRSLESIKTEAQNLANKGFLEIVLTGIHIGMYGKDNNSSLYEAIKIILDNTKISRLRLGSLESVELSQDIINLAKNDKRLAPHFHLPLQSGADTILKAMNRHYTTLDFKRIAENITENLPNASISTDIIVGFPGETEDLFDETLNFAENAPFSRIHVFPYSPRPGTPAAVMKNQVPDTEKKRRVKLLTNLAAKKSHEFMRKFMGKTLSVLFETNENGVTDGLTDNYIRVYTKDKVNPNAIYDVVIDDFYKDGVIGKII